MEMLAVLDVLDVLDVLALLDVLAVLYVLAVLVVMVVLVVLAKQRFQGPCRSAGEEEWRPLHRVGGKEMDHKRNLGGFLHHCSPYGRCRREGREHVAHRASA